MNRSSALKRIRRWLRDAGMTAKDVGVDTPLSRAPDAVLASLLDDIEEDKARMACDTAAQDEALEAMLAEEEVET